MSLAHRSAPLCRAFRRPVALLLLSCAALPLAGCPLQDAVIARADDDASPDGKLDTSASADLAEGQANAGGGPLGAGGDSPGAGGGPPGGGAPGAGNAGNNLGGARPGDPNAILCTASFPMVVRDFPKKHPDFGPSQTTNGRNVELKSQLEDGKPVVANAASDGLDEDDSFNEWFQDEPGTNISFDQQIHLDLWSSGGHLGSRDFYYVDGMGFGNEGEAHNFGFTAEFEVPFTYRVGSFFSFDTSDDVWISIDDTIVASHSVRDGVNGKTVRLDDEAKRLRMKPGSDHKLKIFYAERDGRSSVFRLNTVLDIPCEAIPR
ncbi:fibro-slime domain-containing protein [Sorangium sp. So ce315]|uniref:fibro-slime domain-containing protein n=1 Tax=Sorangium sp. So ce315 TaxID=3133299 RepID=UPI003F5DB89B